MLKSEARTAIRSSYENVAGAPTNAELNVWLDLEQKLFRREMTSVVPKPYTVVDTAQVLGTGADTLTLPARFERLIRLERLVGATYMPVDVSDEIAPHFGELTVREEGAAFKVDPLQLAPGTYRIVYVQAPAALASTDSPDETLDVPPGCEDIINERVAARARVKLQEDPSPHLARAAATWTEQKRALKKRYGRLPEPGLRVVRRW